MRKTWTTPLNLRSRNMLGFYNGPRSNVNMPIKKANKTSYFVEIVTFASSITLSQTFANLTKYQKFVLEMKVNVMLE